MSYIPLIHKKVFLESEQIKLLNSEPIELISTPGEGRAIEVVAVVGKLNFGEGGSPYATNLKLKVVPNSLTGGSSGQLYNTDLLAESADRMEKFVPQEQGRVVENDGISIMVEAGDPTQGDGTLDIFISYRIIYDVI